MTLTARSMVSMRVGKAVEGAVAHAQHARARSGSLAEFGDLVGGGGGIDDGLFQPIVDIRQADQLVDFGNQRFQALQALCTVDFGGLTLAMTRLRVSNHVYTLV